MAGWTRARVLYHWWNESPVRNRVSFDELGETRPNGSPVLLPRWLFPENSWRSPALWLNFRTGVVTMLCISLVLGTGCLVMFFSYEMGWIISFYKGYEEAWIGLTAGIVGSFLFVLGFLYVPLARAHASVVGDVRAFFDARLVCLLIRARPAAFTGLTLVLVLVSILLGVMKTASGWLYPDCPSDAEALAVLIPYLQQMAFVLFAALLIAQGLAARVYRKSMMAALRDGWLEPEDLGPRLYSILSRLALLPERAAQGRGLSLILRWTWNWYSRRFLFGAMFLLGVAYVLAVYLSEFLNHHPFVGFMNHPLLQFPCVDYVPRHLLS